MSNLFSNTDEDQVLVLGITSMTIHNGPGIRTLVQFKGCPLRCLWCSTPESQSTKPQLTFTLSKCIKCDLCIDRCPLEAIRVINEQVSIDRQLCNNCGNCVKVCPTGALAIAGSALIVKEIVDECKKDQIFFKHSGGGVTLSGGEPLMNVDMKIKLLSELKRNGITVGVDTSGYLRKNDLEKMLEYIDFFLWDVKHTDDRIHKKLTGKSNRIILSNLKYVSERGIPVYLRYPVIPGFNDMRNNLMATCKLAKMLKSLVEVDLLPVHHLGRARYQSLGLSYPMENTKLISDEVITGMKLTVESFGLRCCVGG